MLSLKKISLNLFYLITIIVVNSCDLVDPTKVENQQVTDEKLRKSAAGGAKGIIVELQRELAATIGNISVLEVVSDNYTNTSSYLSRQLDNPSTITPYDISIGSIYTNAQSIRALADFGLETLLPLDKQTTDDQKAEVHFYKAMALLLLSENFVAFPIKDGGEKITAKESLDSAIQHFVTAELLTSDAAAKNKITLALARAYRIAGDKIKATEYANKALSLSQDYVLYAEFSTANLTNSAYAFVVSRSSNDLQPLPRLDFLDPKYISDDASIPILKTEEMHLILAEAALSNGDYNSAKQSMINAITLAQSRPTKKYHDTDPRRGRPNDSAMKVKTSPNAPEISRLIQTRNGESVNVYTISHTSVIVNDINALTTREEFIRALYLLRQEIFFLEGRRMSDLGIRLPVTQNQIETNPNIVAGTDGTKVFVPQYIPVGGAELDKFSVNGDVVTITHDMNQLISEHIQEVSPFGF